MLYCIQGSLVSRQPSQTARERIEDGSLHLRFLCLRVSVAKRATHPSRGGSRTAVLGIVKQRDIPVALAFQRVDEAVIVWPRVDKQARGAMSVFRQVKDGVEGHLWVYEGG